MNIEMFESNLVEFEQNKQAFLFSGLTGHVLQYIRPLRQEIENYKNNFAPLHPDLREILFGKDAARSKKSDFKKQLPISTLNVFTTTRCNLACSYCYHRANGLNTGKHMNVETFVKAIVYIKENIGFSNRPKIWFFGGEPLLNFTFIRDAVAFLQKNEAKYDVKFSYSISTNGTILTDEMLAFFKENKISISVSFDGMKELHNKNRVFTNGTGSFEIVKANIEKITKSIKVGIRLTLSVSDGPFDLVKIYEETRKNSSGNMLIGFNADRFTGEDQDNMEKSLEDFAEYFIKNLIKGRIVKFSNLLRPISQIHNGIEKQRLYPCSAGMGGLSLTPDGYLYLCHRFADINSKRIFDIRKPFDKDPRVKFIEDQHVSKRNHGACSACWARYYCGSTCYYTSYAETGSTEGISAFDCFMIKACLKTALNIYASIGDTQRKMLDKVYNSHEQKSLDLNKR